MKTLTTFAKISVPTLALYLLTGCQTTPTPLNTNTPAQLLTHQSLNPQQSQKLLVSTIKSTLYQNQDFVAEQQLFLESQTDKLANKTGEPSRLTQIAQCQNEHDKALVAQLKTDKINTYKAVKKLSEDKKVPYEAIKKTYIDCYHTAETLPERDDELPTDLETMSGTDSEAYPEQVGMAMKVLGFKSGQITNFNNFFAKSGKLIYTGNYRPYQGKLALQLDAGFENKNLRTHYRLPMVVDIKNPTLYVKPDVIMPYTALYLDNQLGMSWQDKWYQFNLDPQQSLPISLSKKATAKAWLKAVTDSFIGLPAQQFGLATSDQITTELLPNLAQATQKPSQLTNSPLAKSQVIHWHQTAEQQIALTQAIINRYIALVEENLTKDTAFLALPENQQTRYRTLWETQKKQLLAYSDNLGKKPELTEVENNEVTEVPADVTDTDNQDIETKTAETKSSDDSKDEDSDDKTFKNPLLASRPQGQDWYFVLTNNQLKHIYIDNGVTVFQQPAKFHTWVTFNPDNRTLAPANQPQSLENLAKTLRPEVVIDGRAEMKRLAELDDSRRLFGQEPKVITYYKDYMKKSKEKAKKASKE